VNAVDAWNLQMSSGVELPAPSCHVQWIHSQLLVETWSCMDIDESTTWSSVVVCKLDSGVELAGPLLSRLPGSVCQSRPQRAHGVRAHRMCVGAVGLRCCEAAGLATCGDSSITAMTACSRSRNGSCWPRAIHQRC
jgi:hypothetical protein